MVRAVIHLGHLVMATFAAVTLSAACAVHQPVAEAAPADPSTAARDAPAAGKVCHAKADCSKDQECVFSQPGCASPAGACTPIDTTCSSLPVATTACACTGKRVIVGACPITFPYQPDSACP